MDSTRIKKLRIPPAWKNVKISKDATSYLQATGTDKSGKTQYIYHPLFTVLTEVEKYKRMREFCSKLHLLKNSIEKDLNSTDSKKSLISFMFLILGKTHARIGSEQYDTFGLCTLEKKHVKIDKDNVIFNYIGKKSVKQHIEINDLFISNGIKKLLQLPGSRLFKYGDNSIKSNDMNEYLKSCMGEDFSCKDFRTYASNMIFLEKICAKKIPETKKDLLSNLKSTYEEVAKELGHTKEISKKSYVMPLIDEKYRENPKLFTKNPLDLLQLFLKDY